MTTGSSAREFGGPDLLKRGAVIGEIGAYSSNARILQTSPGERQEFTSEESSID
jgi:hypothetical protein